METIEFYKSILDGKTAQFPRGFWIGEDVKIECKKITIYLIEEVLKWNDDDIRANLTNRLFIKYKLSGMINIVFLGSPFLLIDNAYPERFKEWELVKVSSGYWNKETAIKATKWMIEEKLNWSIEDVKNNISFDIFKKYGLGGMLNVLYNGKMYDAVKNVYPTIKPYELSSVPNYYWNKETTIEATIWLFEKKLKWNISMMQNCVSRLSFTENGFRGLLSYFNGSPYRIMKNAYPLEDWEMLKKQKISSIDYRDI